jgi:hypothetical protein
MTIPRSLADLQPLVLKPKVNRCRKQQQWPRKVVGLSSSSNKKSAAFLSGYPLCARQTRSTASYNDVPSTRMRNGNKSALEI